MNIYGNLSLRNKILAGFLLVMLLIFALGAVSLVQEGKIATEAQNLGTNLIPSIVALNNIQSALNDTRRGEILGSFIEDKGAFERYRKRLDEKKVEVAKYAELYTKMDLTSEERKTWNGVNKNLDLYFTEVASTFDLIKAGKQAEAAQYQQGPSKKVFDLTMQELKELITFNEKEAVTATSHAASVATFARTMTITILIVTIILSTVISILIAGGISRPVQKLALEVDKLAKGDLNLILRKEGNDEIGRLTDGFSHMVDSLRTIITKVSETSAQVASAANQLYANSEQMATGAEEVAAQAATVATAAEEMAATSGDIAQNCHLAADGSQHASNAACAGATEVEKTIEVMNRIAGRVKDTARTVGNLGERSDQIGAIIGTIEDIADQTNLLALNAAIEAARAGEQGRGFAVVADEVRALAERTTRATREIGDMIKAIQGETRGAVTAMEQGVAQVEEGTSEAAKSGAALQEILDQVNAVSMQVNQIATAAEEQTATSSEISSNIQQMTGVVQETARGAQESASAASQLARHAEDLQRIIGQFKL
jgi:methyl-accepting chemotaxis protein